MKNIYTITLSPCVDKSGVTKRIVPDHKLRCEEVKFEPGGGGINVSRAIKKVGGESTAIYMKGGPAGDLIEEMLRTENITQLPIKCKSWTRENFVVLEKETNQQFRFVMPGGTLEKSEWQACLSLLEDQNTPIDYIVVSGSSPDGVPNEFYKKISQIFKTKNAKLILDTSGESLKAALGEGIYLLKPNTRELGELVGRELSTIKEQEEAAIEVINKGQIEILVVSMGAAGAMIFSKEGHFLVSAPSVRKMSTVGAGDSMVGGIVYSLSQGHSTLEALRFGVACGTASTMNLGTELCKKEDVEKLYKWMSEHYKQNS